MNAFGRMSSGRPSRSLAAPRTSVPALIVEGQTVPKIPLTSPLGMTLAVSGTILVGEGLISIFAAQDQSGWATVFRLFRIALGGGMLVWVAASGE